MLKGQEGGHSGNSLNLRNGVGLGVGSDARSVILLSLSKVDTSDELSDNDEVGALNVSDGGEIGELGRQQLAGSQVGVQVQVLSQLEETLLGSHVGSSVGSGPYGVGSASDSTEHNRVSLSADVESSVGDGLALLLNGSSSNESVLKHKLGAGGLSNRLEHLDGLGNHLGATEVAAEKNNLLGVSLGLLSFGFHCGCVWLYV